MILILMLKGRNAYCGMSWKINYMLSKMHLFSSQHGEELNSLAMKMENLLSCAKVENLK